MSAIRAITKTFKLVAEASAELYDRSGCAVAGRGSARLTSALESGHLHAMFTNGAYWRTVIARPLLPDVSELPHRAADLPIGQGTEN